MTRIHILATLLALTTAFSAPAQVNVFPETDTVHYGRIGGPIDEAFLTYQLVNTTPQWQGVIIEWDPNAISEEVMMVNGGTTPVVVELIPPLSQRPLQVQILSPGVQVSGQHRLQFWLAGASTPIERLHLIDIGAVEVDITPDPVPTLTLPYDQTVYYDVDLTITNNHPAPIPVSVAGTSVDVPTSVFPTSFTLEGNSSQTVEARMDIFGLPLGGPYTAEIAFDEPGFGTQPVGSRTIEFYHGMYPSSDAPLAIDDLGTTVSEIEVPHDICLPDPNDPGPWISVDLDVTHTYIGDLQVSLEAPNGTLIMLHNRSGGGDDNIVRNYSYNDADGPGSLRDIAGSFGGGTWTLQVTDNAPGDSGTLNGWALRLPTSPDCQPLTSDVHLELPTATANFIELPGAGLEPLSYSITTLPTLGSVFDPNLALPDGAPYALSGAGLYYASFEAGPDQFQYTVTDGNGNTSTATVFIRNGVSRVRFEETLDSDPGWTTEGNWGFGVATTVQDPNGGAVGDFVYGYNLNGNYEPNMLQQHLISPSIDFGDVLGGQLVFQRWLQVENSIYDRASISASRDGGFTWETIWVHNGETIFDTAWTQRTYDMSSFDGEADVRLRWTMGTSDNSIQFTGWNIDEIRIVGLGLNDCPGDIDGDGLVVLSDLAIVLADFGLSGDRPSDLNNDGTVDLTDLASVLSLFGTGC